MNKITICVHKRSFLGYIFLCLGYLLIATLFIQIQTRKLLSVSYLSVNEYSASLFLRFVRSSSNSSRSSEGFRRYLVQNFIQILQQVKNFSLTPMVKFACFRQRYNVAESGQVLQWWSMGKFFICCRIELKIRLRVRLKRCNDRGEFELDRAKRKNNDAENSYTLGYETHISTYTTCEHTHNSVSYKQRCGFNQYFG